MKYWFWQLLQPTGENGATRAPIIVDMERDKSGNSRGLSIVLEGRTASVSASKDLTIQICELDSVSK